MRRLTSRPYLGLVILIALVVLLLLYTGGPGEMTLAEKAVVEATGPFQRLINSTSDFVLGVWDRYIHLVQLKDENQRLKEELAGTEEDKSRLKELEMANDRLRRLLDFKSRYPFATVPAEVMAIDPSAWIRTAVINKGSDQGIRPGVGVVSAAGVVGRVVKVSSNYSKVLLITDPNSAVGGVVQRTRARGLVVGSGGGELELKYVEQTLNVEKGDLVVTSALGGIFPKGIIIGRVVEADKRRARLFKRVKVEPRVDLARLEEVLVFMGNPKELEGF